MRLSRSIELQQSKSIHSGDRSSNCPNRRSDTQDDCDVAKPFLRWAGSKRFLLPRLAMYWKTSYLRYIEPFMGSASLFFNLQPRSAILSDVNEELVNAFLAVRNHPRAVHNRLKKLPQGKRSYLKLRATEPSTLDEIDRAARLIFLNRFCFNGIYRTNKDGVFNVPFSASRTGEIPAWETLASTSKALQRATIYHSDFREVLLHETRKGDFVYLDPPFAVANRRIFRQYGPQTFGHDDLGRLADLLTLLDRRGAHFVVSYALCKEGLAAFRGWNLRRVFTQRNISGFATKRRRAVELIVTNQRT